MSISTAARAIVEGRHHDPFNYLGWHREGGEPVLMTQDEFAKYVLADVERWRQIVKDIKLQLE
jgi:hypothetical protein